MRLGACALVVLAAVAGSAGTATAAQPATPGTLLQTDLTTAQANDGLIGVIGMVRDGTTVEYASAGQGDMLANTPADPHARFRIGSNTKAFVATVLLQLEAEGKLSLNDTVEKWLPGVVDGNGYDGTKITIRELLNHTSGIADYFQQLSLQYGLNLDPNQQFTPLQLVDIGLSQAPVFAPGTGWSYSNTNYILAGMIIKAVTGNDPAVEVTNRIITPLGLTNTVFPTSDPTMPGNHLSGYYHLRSGIFYFIRDVTVSNVQMAGAAGAIVSTTDDLANFERALFSGQLLPPAQQAELETTVPATGGDYGLGVGRWQTPCGPAWSHNGAVLGYESWWLTSSDGSRQVVVATNQFNLTDDQGTDTDIGKALTDAYCATAP